MAVIITGMGMLKGCWYETDKKMSGLTICPLIDECRRKHINVDKLNEFPQDCPLKSADEMIAEICNLKYGNEEISETDEERAKAYNCGVENSLSIIHKYCDKEQNNN